MTAPALRIRLYHGSNVLIEQPSVSFNTGFADLGKGFYLTDDLEAARGRAQTRARKMGGEPIVSVFDLDESVVEWATWGERMPRLAQAESCAPFGLRFDATPEGYAAWATYIKDCRQGNTVVAGIGNPAIVRAWIATMEVEMVCSGFLDAQEIPEVLDPTTLIVQYCMLDQRVIDQGLKFIGMG